MDADEEFRWLFISEYPSVVRTTYLVLHDHARAEEIAQDAFVQLMRHWTKVRSYESPSAWLRRVAIRLAVKEARRDQRRLVLTRRAQGAPLSQPSPEPESDEELIAAIRQLSPQQRSVVVLFYYEDRPMDQIAEILGCTPATGWVHLHKARKRLGVLLETEVRSDVD